MRRRHQSQQSDNSPGEDSFLDIVANLVGVLIILVVVVGANAGSKIRDIAVAEVDQRELGELDNRLHNVRRAADSLLQDNAGLERQIELERELAEQRSRERQLMLIQLQTARQHLEAQKIKLSGDQQKFMAMSERIAGLQRKLTESKSRLEAVSNSVEQDNTIEHFPTPIARTVFSDEIHFRLRQGRIVHVPMDELVDLMKNEWQEKARKLDVANETLETVGPIGDFRLQYQLKIEQVTMQNGYRDMTRRVPQFTKFVLLPISESIGEPMDRALQEGSAFRQLVDAANPAKTTVSVWVYPESFAEFNQLKHWLYENGFKTACWPLSNGSPISGGPSGYRSTAQ